VFLEYSTVSTLKYEENRSVKKHIEIRIQCKKWVSESKSQTAFLY